MPSFDVVSKVDLQEVKNAVEQAERQIRTRFDLKDTKCAVTYDEVRITLTADDQMRLQAVHAIIREKLAKRSVSLKSIEFKEPEKASGDSLRQELEIKQGISEEDRKKVNVVIKASKIKVTSQIQGDQVRVTGKKRDDLQAIIAELRSAPSLSQLELQFINFRD